MYEIQMTEPQNVGAVNHEAPWLLESDYDDNDLYQVENTSLDKTKEKMEWSKRALECEGSYLISNRNNKYTWW